MKDATDALRMIIVVILTLFVLIIVVPILLKLIGLTLVFLVGLAMKVIYLAVFLAVCYLILVGLRALLR
jgi:hypothetical protein